MTKKQLSDWLFAMRSGKYRKGRCVLRLELPEGDEPTSPQYCALGVLHEITGGKWPHFNNTISLGLLETSEQIAVMGVNDRNNKWAPVADWVEQNIKAAA